jgi:RNA polymerase sigma-70 factor (ECF subfamily)
MTVMDSHWLELCREGEAGAIERLVSTHQEGLYRLAYSILEDAHEAEDVVQETFLAALRALDSFEQKAAFSTWLAAIALNLSRTRLKRRQSRLHLTEVLKSLWPWHQLEAASLEQTVIQDEGQATVWRAICSLDEKQRLPVILRYYHDYPVAEIAALLQIPEGTVHSRLNKARATLRAALQEGQP